MAVHMTKVEIPTSPINQFMGQPLSLYPSNDLKCKLNNSALSNFGQPFSPPSFKSFKTKKSRTNNKQNNKRFRKKPKCRQRFRACKSPNSVKNDIIDNISPNEHLYPPYFLNRLLSLAASVPWTKNCQKDFSDMVNGRQGIDGNIFMKKLEDRIKTYQGYVNKKTKRAQKREMRKLKEKTVQDSINNSNENNKSLNKSIQNAKEKLERGYSSCGTEDDVVILPVPPVQIIEIDEDEESEQILNNVSDHGNNDVDKENHEDTSNDFLATNDTESTSEKFNFSLHGHEFIDYSFIKPPDRTDTYEIDSSTTTSECINRGSCESSTVFKEVNFLDENLFKGDDLSAFKESISSQNYVNTIAPPPVNTDNTKSPKKKQRHSKSKTTSETSSESDYEIPLNAQTYLPDLSPIAVQNAVTPSKKKKSKKRQLEVECDDRDVEKEKNDSKRIKKSKRDEEIKEKSPKTKNATVTVEYTERNDDINVTEERLNSSEELDLSVIEIMDKISTDSVSYTNWQKSITEIQREHFNAIENNEQLYSPNFLQRLIAFAENVPWSKKCEKNFRKLRNKQISEKTFLKNMKRKLKKNIIIKRNSGAKDDCIVVMNVNDMKNGKGTMVEVNNDNEKPEASNESKIEVNADLSQEPLKSSPNQTQIIGDLNELVPTTAHPIKLEDISSFETALNNNMPLPIIITDQNDSLIINESIGMENKQLQKRKSEEMDNRNAKKIRKESDKLEEKLPVDLVPMPIVVEIKSERIEREAVNVELPQDGNCCASDNIEIKQEQQVVDTSSNEQQTIGEKQSEPEESLKKNEQLPKQIDIKIEEKSNNENESEKQETKNSAQNNSTMEINQIKELATETNRISDREENPIECTVNDTKSSQTTTNISVKNISELSNNQLFNINDDSTEPSRANKRKHDETVSKSSETINDKKDNEDVFGKLILIDVWQDKKAKVETFDDDDDDDNANCLLIEKKRRISSTSNNQNKSNDEEKSYEINRTIKKDGDDNEESDVIILNSSDDAILNKDFIVIEDSEESVKGEEEDDVVLIEDKMNPIILSDSTSDSEIDLSDSNDQTSNLNLANTTLPNLFTDARYQTMSNDPTKWQIIEADKYRKRVNNSSPAKKKCYTCKHHDHAVSACPQFVDSKCVLCGAKGHLRRHCPNAICLQCGNPVVSSTKKGCKSCRSLKTEICKLCNEIGHTENYCSNLWRRYHLTTENGPIVVPSDQRYELKPKCDLWCCHCGKRGHISSRCKIWQRQQWRGRRKRSKHYPVPQSTSPTRTNCPYYLSFDQNRWQFIHDTKENATHTYQISNTTINQGPQNKNQLAIERNALVAFLKFTQLKKNKYLPLMNFNNVELKNNLLLNKLTGLSLYLNGTLNPRLTIIDSSNQCISSNSTTIDETSATVAIDDLAQNNFSTVVASTTTATIRPSTLNVKSEPAKSLWEEYDPKIFFKSSQEALLIFITSAVSDLDTMNKDPMIYLSKYQDVLESYKRGTVGHDLKRMVFKELNMFIFGICAYQNVDNMKLLRDFANGIIRYNDNGKWRPYLKFAFESVFHCFPKKIDYLKILNQMVSTPSNTTI